MSMILLNNNDDLNFDCKLKTQLISRGIQYLNLSVILTLSMVGNSLLAHFSY